MEYTIKVSENKRYILMTYKGTIDNRKAFECSEKAQTLGKELGINKFLIDSRNCPNEEPAASNYNLAYKDIPNEPPAFNTIIAIVASPDDHSHDFIETVFRNTAKNVTLFRDYNEAVSYLEDQ